MTFKEGDGLYNITVFQLMGTIAHYAGVVNWRKIGTTAFGNRFFVMIDSNFQSTTDKTDPIFEQFKFISLYGRHMSNLPELWPAQIRNYWNVFTKTSFKD